MSLLGKPSPKKTILLMKVYVSSPEKMFMFWGHELMMVSCLQQVSSKEILGGGENTFLEGPIMYTYICINIAPKCPHLL